MSSYPSFRFLAPGAEFAVDEGLTSAHGENIIAYMNGKCGTIHSFSLTQGRVSCPAVATTNGTVATSS